MTVLAASNGLLNEIDEWVSGRNAKVCAADFYQQPASFRIGALSLKPNESVPATYRNFAVRQNLAVEDTDSDVVFIGPRTPVDVAREAATRSAYVLVDASVAQQLRNSLVRPICHAPGFIGYEYRRSSL